MEWYEDNNGMNVVNWIISNNYKKNTSIIIHSWNIPRAMEMNNRLIESGYSSVQYPGVWNLIGS